jgi:hypothetical protein
MTSDGFDLAAINVVKSRLSGQKRIVNPVFVFRNGQGALEKFVVPMDVTNHR